jgi:hypothetical protein
MFHVKRVPPQIEISILFGSDRQKTLVRSKVNSQDIDAAIGQIRFQRNQAKVCGTPLVQLSMLVKLNCLGCPPQSLQRFFLDGSCNVNR